jgi:hypothetical protein
MMNITIVQILYSRDVWHTLNMSSVVLSDHATTNDMVRIALEQIPNVMSIVMSLRLW